MGHSHKNTSQGGMGKGDSKAFHLPIKENVDPKPPAGASNSYEKVRSKIDAHNDARMGRMHYTREKMANK
jgi:hypothetical protein